MANENKMRNPPTFILFLTVTIAIVSSSATQSTTKDNEAAKAPEEIAINENEKTAVSETSREKSDKKGGMMGNMMTKLLPMMVVPFLISSAIVPMALVSLKFMIFQSILIGKIAIILMIVSMFRNRGGGGMGGVFNHNVNDRDGATSMAHYGYTGGEEYGAYINRRKKKK